MNIVDRGSGPPLVLIPGLQGRWEYMRPAVDALASSFRVLTFSLDADDFDGYAAQVDRALDGQRASSARRSAASRSAAWSRCGSRRSTRTAAARSSWRRRRSRRCGCGAAIRSTCARRGSSARSSSPSRRCGCGRRSAPRFPTRARAGAFRAATGCARCSSRAVSLSRMAARARLIDQHRSSRPDCARITAPTLIVTGERGLDHVVPVEGSSEYARRIPNARAVVLERTGHLGSITRPEAFADVVRDFVDDVADARESGLMALREIAGPAGRLEALLDEPAAPGAIGADGRVSVGHPDGLRAAVVFAHPHTGVRRHDAHQGGVSGGEGAEPDRLRGAALQLPRRRRERRQLQRTAPARWTISAPRSISCTRSIRTRRSGRPACRSARGSR